MNRKLHYAWIVVIVTFLVLFFSMGVRTIPSVIIKPLEGDFGWDRTSISFAVAVSLFAFGLGGPIAGSLVDRFGPRRVMLAGLAFTGLGLLPLVWITELWQFHLLWGLVVGVGTGAISNVLGATVANRWFNNHRGVVLGILGASGAVGQFLILPSLIQLSTSSGWRAVIAAMAGAILLTIIPVLFLMRNQPGDVKLEPVGGASSAARAGIAERGTPLREAVRTVDFWLLALSFFICGYTTNGLIGTHLLPHAVEHGFVEVETAGALSLMGLMNIVGTLASGWLSDRYDNRKLLMTYYGLRGLSLVALPFIIEMQGLLIFAVIYGLDWIATVPPTVNLTVQRFGRATLGTIYGWIWCAHMIGAGIAAQAGGFFHDQLGDYQMVFLSAAVLGLVAAGLSTRMSIDGRKTAPPAAPVLASSPAGGE